MTMLSTPVGEVAVASKTESKLRPAPADTPLSGIARLMLKHEAEVYPVEGGKSIGADAIVAAIKETSAFAKREARTVMNPCPVLKESRVRDAKNKAHESGLPVIPIVNDSGHLVAAWVDGKVFRRPPLAKSGTHVKLIADKVLRNPVVVVDKHRVPQGVITKRDMLELAASFKEFEVPIFYSGLETVPVGDKEPLQSLVAETVHKLGKITPIMYASLRLTKRKLWVVKLKLSTPLRTFLATGEAQKRGVAVAKSLDRLSREVMHEKEKRLKLRKVY
jgi:hypothetical protein